MGGTEGVYSSYRSRDCFPYSSEEVARKKS